MNPRAAGRILLWRGGSLWIGLALEATGFHSHHAVQISLSLSDGAVQFRRPEREWTSYPAAIVAANQPHASQPPDPRIAAAQRLIRARLQEALSLRALAAAVHLPPERFRHLFVEQTGVGLRPYLLWLRLECALGAFIAGASLTEAAHTGGFADSAHFSRTFKKMFGMAPASVRTE